MTLRVIIVLVLVVHALIHVMGFAKAFGFAELPQLQIPISRPMGVLWLAAALLALVAAIAFAMDARWFWIVGAFAAVASQVVIIASWGDARFGSIANAVLALLALMAFCTNGPGSLRERYERAVATCLSRDAARAPVAEGDLAALPAPVQRYLRQAGVIGEPRVRNFRAHFKGRIRSSATSVWMPFVVEQVSGDGPAERLFYMRATMYGIPVVAYHHYIGAHAAMQVKVAGLVPMVNASGPVMDQAETVTLFNDMCLLAPSTLLDHGIVWGAVRGDTVNAVFTNAGHTISADLVFDATGALVDFVSDDRTALAPDGKTLIHMRWTTPVSGYREFGGRRLFASGAARDRKSVV